MKRTNVFLDEDLVAEGLALTGLPSMRSLVDQALRDLVRRERQKRLLPLKGRIRWEGNLNSMRRLRTA